MSKPQMYVFFLKIQLIFVPIAVIGLVLITVGGATVHVAFDLPRQFIELKVNYCSVNCFFFVFSIMLLDCF